MKSMLEDFYTKPLIIYLAVALLALSTFSGSAEAMFVPSATHRDTVGIPAAPANRAEDLVKIQSALESKIIRQKMADYGLSPEETMARVNKLSDVQIHQLATHADSIQAGGDPVDVFVGLLIVALLVVLLIYLLQGHVEVR